MKLDEMFGKNQKITNDLDNQAKEIQNNQLNKLHTEKNIYEEDDEDRAIDTMPIWGIPVGESREWIKRLRRVNPDAYQRIINGGY
jgi:hypothetical protein